MGKTINKKLNELEEQMTTKREFFTHEGKIIKKLYNEKNGPKGWYFLEEDGREQKYTAWSQSLIDKYQEGDEVIITYTIQDNEYNGRVYKNRIVDSMRFKNEGQVQFSEQDYKALEEAGLQPKKTSAARVILSENGVVKLGGLYYRIKEIELELLDNKEDFKTY